MRTVELDDDVYSHLRQNTDVIGESASAILRRLLSLPNPVVVSASMAPAVNGGNNESGAQATDTEAVPLLEKIKSDRFRFLGNATDKFLQILKFAYEDDPEKFASVLGVAGRTRKYFARSRGEISNSGRHTYPREIPGTSFWALTNADTNQKRDILRQALHRLGYGKATIDAASAAVR